MVTARRPAPAAAEEEPAPLFEIPAGAIQEPIKTLDLAQRIGIHTARLALTEAARALEAAQAMLDKVFVSVGLSPDLEYEIDEEGHVFPGPPRPNA